MISTDGDKVQYRSISVCSNLDEEGTAEDGSGKVVGVSLFVDHPNNAEIITPYRGSGTVGGCPPGQSISWNELKISKR